MSEYQIIRFCAPTLAGLKTASLFCCDAPDEAELLGAAAPLEHFSRPEGPADASAAHLERRRSYTSTGRRRWRATWPVRMRPACSTAAVTMARSLPAACAA